MRTDFDAEQGQEGLEDHYEQWFAHIATDFRATSLNRLVLGLVPEGRVLDIGCGSGALSAELLRAGRRLVSQDVSPRMVLMAKKHLERQGLDASQVRLGTIESITERGAFDGIVALDVIEHIDDDLQAVVRLRDALTPTGRLVLSVPALSWLYGPKDVAVGHFRRYSRDALTALLSRAGFEVETCRYWNALGILPVWVANLRGKRLDESLRYSNSPIKRALNAALGAWFTYIENPLPAPLGMTLLVRARPR